MTIILFPDNYYCNHEPDSDYEEEYQAALNEGFNVAFLSNEALDDDKIKITMPQAVHGDMLYRGWIMKPDMYKKLARKADNLGCKVMVTPEQYERFHTLPGYYAIIKEDSPKAIWFEDRQIDWAEVRNTMARCMVKDYVKSVKNTGFPSYLDLNELNNTELDAYIDEFIKLRDDLMTGGIVLKEYVDLKRYHGMTNEYRVFYFNRHIVSISRNSGQSEDVACVPNSLINKYIMDGFYTIDYAEKQDGSWMIIECGDGQVSGLPCTLKAETFYHKLREILVE